MNTTAKTNGGAKVHIVDDDVLIRKTTAKLLETHGFIAQTYASANEFLDSLNSQTRGCLILDIHMPGITGLELQQRISAQGINLPIIFLTGYGDVPMASQAFRQGAVDFLEKPFQTTLLIDRVKEALQRDTDLWQGRKRRKVLLDLYQQLTDREKMLIKLVSCGYTAREIGNELCISHRTVETHRAKVMKKLQAESLADLISISMELEAELTEGISKE